MSECKLIQSMSKRDAVDCNAQLVGNREIR